MKYLQQLHNVLVFTHQHFLRATWFYQLSSVIHLYLRLQKARTKAFLVQEECLKSSMKAARSWSRIGTMQRRRHAETGGNAVSLVEMSHPWIGVWALLNTRLDPRKHLESIRQWGHTFHLLDPFASPHPVPRSRAFASKHFRLARTMEDIADPV